MSEQLKFFKGNETDLPEEIEQGAIYHCEDTGNTYLGGENNGSKRFSSAVGKTVLDDNNSPAGEIFNDYENNSASGQYSHAEGSNTTASGYASHAEGEDTIASGENSHVEGYDTKASDDYSHAEGLSTTASGYNSHAEGYNTEASGESSHTEGAFTTASGTNSHAEGYNTTASGSYSHAEGHETSSIGSCSHTEGVFTEASGNNSHAEGHNTLASGHRSHAEGYFTIANTNQHAQGHYNNSSMGSDSGTGGTAFIIGNGTATNSRSNAFRITYGGATFAKAAYNASGADYAEFFEWEDGNPFDEDRRGYFVTLNNDKIKIATPEDDFILGVVSGQPAIIGNSDEEWTGRYILDEFGSFITEEFEYEEKTLDPETEEEIVTIKTGIKYKENPEYDPSQTYIQRQDRAEWATVGMLGVLSVRDDGTCQVNGYCSIAKDGTATMSLSGYRVIKRVNDNTVKIIFR